LAFVYGQKLQIFIFIRHLGKLATIALPFGTVTQKDEELEHANSISDGMPREGGGLPYESDGDARRLA